MERKTIDGDTVNLIPAGDGAVEMALGLGAEPGTLSPQMLVRTENLGTFRIPLTAVDLGLIAAWGQTVLSMTDAQAAEMIRKLTANQEGTTDDV